MDIPVVLEPRPKRFQLPKQIKRQVLFSLLLTALICFFAVFIYSISQPKLPLFYSLSQPEDQLVRHEWVFVIPVISVILFILHLVILNILSKLDEEVMKLFNWLTFFLLGLTLFILIRLMIVL